VIGNPKEKYIELEKSIAIKKAPSDNEVVSLRRFLLVSDKATPARDGSR
jgi:hypothetical protein